MKSVLLFVFVAICGFAALVVAQEKDLISGHYRYIHQNHYEDFLKAYGVTDEKKIAEIAASKPELVVKRNGDEMTVTFIEAPAPNNSFTLTFGKEYEADFFGVGKKEKTITTLENGDTIMSKEIDNPTRHRIGKFTEKTHTMTFYAGEVIAVRTFERISPLE